MINDFKSRSFYWVASLVVLDFLLGSFQGWFENIYWSAIWLLAIFLFLFLKPAGGIILLVFTAVLDYPEVFYLRPYQWLLLFIILIFVIKKGKSGFRFFSENKKVLSRWGSQFFKKIKFWQGTDYFFLTALFFLVLGSLLGLINASFLLYSLKQTAVLFIVLLTTLVVRYFSWGKGEKRKIIRHSFIFSSFPVSLLALYQNIAHEQGLPSFMVMEARPNATFWEPDWLGIYALLVLVLLLVEITKKKRSGETNFLFWFLILINQIVLIITVARASWLGLITVFLVYGGFSVLAYFLGKISARDLGRIAQKGAGFLLTGVLALVLIQTFQLTRFDLSDRFLSIFQGEHKVTIAEKKSANQRFKIDLEEIDYYKSRGFSILEEKVADENIDSRFQAYASNWEMVKEHFILGQGQGSVMAKRGFLHNANNIFWQWWITAGLWGLIGFLALVLFPYFSVFRYLLKSRGKKDFLGYWGRLAPLLGASGIIVVNIFNAGIFFIPLWIFMGAFFLPDNFKKNKKNSKI